MRRGCQKGAHKWRIGVGDDAAVLKALGQVVITTDMLIEDVDFRRRWASWADVGHKAAAVNLSDLAAMGASAVGLNVGLAAAPHELCRDMLRLLLSCHEVGAAAGAPIIGGDLSQTSGPLVLSVTAVGIASARPLLRHRGQVGDRIFVTGSLGAAAAGLWLLEHAPGKLPLPRKTARALMQRQLRPTAQLAAAKNLARANVVRSMADISDGLHQDLRHVLPEHLGALIDADALPVADGVHQVAVHAGKQGIDLALLGGEDFELVMVVPARHVTAAQRACSKVGVALTDVGVVTATSSIIYTGHAAPSWRHGQGYHHFQQ